MNKKQQILAWTLLAFCILQNGCALLTLPFQLAGAGLGLAGDALNLMQALPLPPPWVFF